MKKKITADQFTLRCYGYRKHGVWLGVCIDLNLAIQAKSSEELKSKMKEVIDSYFESVIDTNDYASITALLSRGAPFSDRLRYYLIKMAFIITSFTGTLLLKNMCLFALQKVTVKV